MVKKILGYGIILLLVSSYGFSLSWKDFSFSGGVSTDYYTGEIREIVYPDQGWANDYLSELLWQIDNIVMLTGHFKVSLSNFSLHLSAGTALNKGTGGMDDYDWLNSSSKIWTNWSNSDIFLDKSVVIDSSLTYTFKPGSTVTIPVGVGYKLNYLNWSDLGYKYIYYWDFKYNKYYTPILAGDWGGIPGICYTFVQNMVYLNSGIQLHYRHFDISLSGSFSPLVFAWDLDHHLRNKKDGTGTFYHDSFISHVWYKVGGSLSYALENHRGIIMLKTMFEELPEVQGDTYIYDENSSDSTKIGTYTGSYKKGAGLASKIFSVSVEYTYRF